MSEADRIFDELTNTLSRWGLEEIPFTESASSLGLSQLREVFTGRTQELREVLTLFQGRERKRILVYGWVGIGKTAFILEVLSVLQRKAKDTLLPTSAYHQKRTWQQRLLSRLREEWKTMSGRNIN